MHKRLTKNASTAIEKAKKIVNTTNLRKIDATIVLKNIAKQEGSFGKIVLNSINKKNNTNFLLPRKNNKFLSVQELLNIAARFAYSTNSPYIGTEHLVHSFLSIVTVNKSKKQENKKVKPYLNKKNKDINSIDDKTPNSPNDFLGEINSLIENFFNPQGTGPRKHRNNSLLADFSINLNYEATSNDHILIGREDELERISYILGRKMKNNPVLIGEPGVGKTAIVEGLARKIEEGTAPFYLIGKTILSLDLNSLIAGTTFRGEFEARLKNIISEAKNNPNVILFIDEIHNLIGAGNINGSMDAANILKPALSRGEIQVIGATTINEYQKHIEKDSAFERRFQPILTPEPSTKESLQIIKGIKPIYEKYHNVKISKEAINSSVILAKRYITDRHLPDSAIDLIDETSARLRGKLSNGLIFHEIKFLEKKLEKITEEKEFLVLENQYEAAIRIRQKENEILEKLDTLKKELKSFESKNQVSVSDDEIRKTLSLTSGIPNELLSQNNSSIAKAVKINLNKNLVGQKKVNEKIIETVTRQVSGIANPDRPLGSFLFVGPTGVGKTLTAKILSEAISPKKEQALIQINMSEFTERHSISRLLGSPAGYVGFEEKGELVNKLRRNPYSIVLFDEIEKADPSVLNILLQILEEGELSDAKGKKINFRNTIMILTSNIGTEELDNVAQLGFEIKKKEADQEEEKTRKIILEEIEEFLLPELRNRLDDILIFNSLCKKSLSEIVSKELRLIQKRLRERKIKLNFSEKLIDYLTKKSSNSKQGARLVRKNIQSEIEPLIAKRILSGKKIKELNLDFKNKKVIIKSNLL